MLPSHLLLAALAANAASPPAAPQSAPPPASATAAPAPSSTPHAGTPATPPPPSPAPHATGPAPAGPAPAKIPAPEWKHATSANNVGLDWYTSVEHTSAGEQAYIYLRLENTNPHAVEGAVGVDVTCKSGKSVHLGFDDGAIGVLNPGETFGGFPHLYRAVCKVGDTVERIEADLRFTPLDPAHVQAPPEPMPNWTPDHIPEPGPPPVAPGAPGAPGVPNMQQNGQFPPRPPLPQPPASSRGTLVEVRYGLTAMAVPLQGVTTSGAGFTSDYHTTAGGLGPRIALDVWPYYSRWFSVAVDAIIDFTTIGLSNGFSYGTDLAGGLTFQGGDERFLTGVVRVREGYRNAHSTAGGDNSIEQSDGSFGGNYTRFTGDLRMCIDGAHPVGACARGADLGFGYDLLGYAANNGGWFIEAGFWMRHHFTVNVEVGWDYAAGGTDASHKATPWHNAFVGFGLQFSDMFWNGY